ncbi:MAG: AAA family ATPase [Spirochaetaceae bacterium]|nr:AAA family ATPase [Spirochaetaceae bacterium]
MGVRLQKAIFHNRAPFEHLELDFQDSNIAVLSGINGRGKTTILSHIVDAFYEMAKKGFINEFEGRTNKLYRISSSLQNIIIDKPSFVYFRFFYENKILDYLDVRNMCTEEEYNTAIPIEQKILYSSFQNNLEKSKVVKTININTESVISLFDTNLLTYFPAYRYEQPGYLNIPYKINLNFDLGNGYSGYLSNPIEVISDLPNIANWLMDVVLDIKLYEKNNSQDNSLWNEIHNLINKILGAKTNSLVRFGIGQRQAGSTRIQILKIIGNGKEESLYPSIFNLSSGEAALLCLFGEILKQTDKIRKNENNVTGIVLIDEVDKHLHIKLQKEILPSLFSVFPNIQFIVSSHSPFFSMGLADEKTLKTTIFDLDNDGLPTNAENNELYQEVYSMMIDKNNQYAKACKELKQKIDDASRTVIITEGKTDSKHLQNAFARLKLSALNADFIDVENIENGADILFNRLKEFSILQRSNKIIGIFDRDIEKILKNLNDDTDKYKSFGNNVYAFAIPLVNETEYGKNISIEHYYHKKDLLKPNSDQRRLFLGDEFYESGNSKDGNYQTKISQIQNKIKVNGVIDDKVYEKADLEMKTNIALTKNDFSNLVSDNEYSKDFDFSNFRKIYDILKEIIENVE